MGPSDAQQAQQVAQDIHGRPRKFRSALPAIYQGSLQAISQAETYDAVTLTVLALQTAGSNRARVRDQIAEDEQL